MVIRHRHFLCQRYENTTWSRHECPALRYRCHQPATRSTFPAPLQWRMARPPAQVGWKNTVKAVQEVWSGHMPRRMEAVDGRRLAASIRGEGRGGDPPPHPVVDPKLVRELLSPQTLFYFEPSGTLDATVTPQKPPPTVRTNAAQLPQRPGMYLQPHTVLGNRGFHEADHARFGG